MSRRENSDLVNHPSHYTSGSVECIDAIQASMSAEEFRGYLKGNIIKYIWRYRNKRDESRDLAKASWYLDKLRKFVETGNGKKGA